MSLRLEELRRRLLQPGPSPAATYTAMKRDPEAALTPDSGSPTASTNGFATSESESAPMKQQYTDPQRSLQDEQLNGKAGGEIRHAPAAERVESGDDLAQAVAKLFAPARQCQERFAEIATSSVSILELTNSTADLYEPLKKFRDHIQRLSTSYGSMRAFQDELGVLAESFEPVRVLHEKIVQLADAVQAHLADLAKSLEPAAMLRAQIARLTAILDSVGELQAQFYDMSTSFGPSAMTGEANVERVQRQVA
jgi:hypothetical protein